MMMAKFEVMTRITLIIDMMIIPHLRIKNQLVQNSSVGGRLI